MADVILEMLGVFPHQSTHFVPGARFELRLMPGECVLVEARNRALAGEFADLCCGLGVGRGGVRFLGRDWAAAADAQQAAMRGRIGRTYGAQSWIGFHGTDMNILAAQLHHTRRPEHELREAAGELARRFGLPGLPLVPPNALSASDLVRADCIRAFLGNPRLVIVDDSDAEEFPDLLLALMAALTPTRTNQGAGIWLTGCDEVWMDRAFPATKRLRLTDRGLVPARDPP
jgi:phospholipid/cholesterol/gamma-HCH transport system ATP-binding protein